MKRIAQVLVVMLMLSIPPIAQAQAIVFDPTNFTQNLLTAARELQQIDNQVTQLQNQAHMLLNQGKNLKSLDYDTLAQLLRTLSSTNRLLAQAQGLTFQVAQSKANFTALYPKAYRASTSSETMLQDAEARWQTSEAALQTATQMQSQAAQNLLADQNTLSGLVIHSQGAVGQLQATQATNQLLALLSRQAIQAQQLAIAQGRATALDQARRAATQARSQQVRARFLGNGPQYTPQPIDFDGH